MPIWSKLWSALDKYLLWLLDSDTESMVREVACYVPVDPREGMCVAPSPSGVDFIGQSSAEASLYPRGRDGVVEGSRA